MPGVKRERSPAWMGVEGERRTHASFTKDDVDDAEDNAVDGNDADGTGASISVAFPNEAALSSSLQCRGVADLSSAPLEKKVPNPP